MDLTRENLDALFTSLNTALNKGLEMADKSYLKWCSIITSKGALEGYPILLVSGTMRKWFGDRQINQLDGKRMNVLNEDYEHTEAVRRNDISDDQIGFYTPLFQAMGVNAENLWPQIATMALTAYGNWADGKPFFSSATSGASARKLGKATIVNKTVLALNATNYAAAKALMMGFCGADGMPLGLVPTHLMHGPALDANVRTLLKAEMVSDGDVAVSNIYKDDVEPVLNPFLSGAHAADWFLLCLNRGINPVAVQKRHVGALTRWDSDHDANVKDKNENHYGLHYRGAAVGAVPQLVIGNFPSEA